MDIKSTSIKRSPLGQRKGDLLKRGSIYMKFSKTGQEKGDLLIQPVTSLTDLSVCPNTGDFIDRFVCMS